MLKETYTKFKKIPVRIGVLVLTIGVLVVASAILSNLESLKPLEGNGNLGSGKIKTAQLVDIIDADTLVLSENNKLKRVRIAGVDAPELNTKWYKESTIFVKKTLENNPYQIEKLGKDAYNRDLVLISVQLSNSHDEFEGDLGEMLLKKGFAKITMPVTGRVERYRQAQTTAKELRLGIWSQPQH